jgi:hypothetical protein
MPYHRQSPWDAGQDRPDRLLAFSPCPAPKRGFFVGSWTGVICGSNRS